MPIRRFIIALALLAVLVALGGWWRAVSVMRQLLRVDAPAAIREKSGNVYQAAVGRVRFNPLRRRVTVDTIHVSTNDTVNAARPQQRSALRLSFKDCTLSGVRVFGLIFRRGLVAETFGCAAVTAAVSSPTGPLSPSLRSGQAVRERGDARDDERAFFVLQQSVRLPASAPQVRVARIDFPKVALDLRLARAHGEARLRLEQLGWLMTGFLIDPRDATAAARPLFSDTVEIRAAHFVGELDSVTAVTVGALSLSLSDSTFDVANVAFAPRQTDSAFARSHPYRRTLVRTSAARIRARGLDVGVFLLREDLRARRVEVDSLRIDVFSDHRRPKNPRPPRRRTPQGWIDGIGRGIHLDSVVIRDGDISYREQRSRHAAPGVMTFARLNAVATNVRHIARSGGSGGRTSSRDPLTLSATAWLQNAGKLDAQFVVPLDAPHFTMTFRGRLGPMPVTRLNAFVEEAASWRLGKGSIESITFTAQVTSGVAHGTVIPRYRDLALEVTGKGSNGIMGTGGVIGAAARGVATFVGNLTTVRSDNPEDGDTVPRTGVIAHAFTPDQTLPAFLWKSLRGGLLAVVRK